MNRRRPLIGILAILFAGNCGCFYLPGLAPKDYEKDKELYIYANTIQSPLTDLPYDFYNPHLNFPKPDTDLNEEENLGSVLSGDRLVKSPFKAGL
jgi:transmembrane 9 superfamily member 2/4